MVRLSRHETAADRVVVARGDHLALRIERGEAHAIGVVGQLLALVHDQVALLVEADLVLPEQADAPVAADAFQRLGDDVRVDAVRQLAFQAHQQRLVGAVAAPGQRQRAIDFGMDARHVAEPAGFVQPARHETRGRAHRPDRMRGARPDADLEQVEGTDGHGRILRLHVQPTASPPCRPD